MDRGIADRNGVFEDVQGTGDGISTRRIAGTEKRTAIGPHRERHREPSRRGSAGTGPSAGARRSAG